MNKVVVISGVGAGMGYEVAKILAGKGMSIAGFDMDPEAIKTTQRDLQGIGGIHHLETLDITDRAGILQFRDKVLADYGHVDTVLSNVGVGFFGPFEEIDLEKALKNVESNLFGAAALNNIVEEFKHLAGPLPAGAAFPAGFVLCKLHKKAGDLDHTGGVVHDHQPA